MKRPDSRRTHLSFLAKRKDGMEYWRAWNESTGSFGLLAVNVEQQAEEALDKNQWVLWSLEENQTEKPE